jgi:hypothetical protein
MNANVAIALIIVMMATLDIATLKPQSASFVEEPDYALA